MWKDEFEENLSVSYGLFEDSKQNIYLIGLEGLRIYDKNFNPTTSMYISRVIFCLAIVGAVSYLVLVRNRKSN